MINVSWCLYSVFLHNPMLHLLGLCTNSFAVTMSKTLDKKTLQSKDLVWFMVLGKYKACEHSSWRRILRALTLSHKYKAERESEHREGHESWKSQSLSPVTRFVYQAHPS